MIQKGKLNNIIICLAVVMAVFSWWSVYSAMVSNSSNGWVFASVGFSFVFFLTSVLMITEKSTLTLELVMSFIMVLSLPFGPKISHIAYVSVASFLAIVASRRIRRDFELNVKVDIWKSLRMGKTFILAAFALVLASQYYSLSIENISEKRPPKIESGNIAGELTMKLLAYLNPSFASLEDEEITIDEFILLSWDEKRKNLEQDKGSVPTELFETQFEENSFTQEQKEFLRGQISDQIMTMRDAATKESTALILQEGRKQFSQMTGKDIVGNEKVSEIFSGIIDKNFAEFFAPNPEFPHRAKVYPAIVSIIMFLSILSLASLVWWPMVLLVVGFFHLLVKIGVIKIDKVNVEAEIIR